MSAEKAIAIANHKLAMDEVVKSSQRIAQYIGVLNSFVEAENGMHSYLHITDPTLYRDAINSKEFEAQLKISKAAISFVKDVVQIKGELLEALLAGEQS